MRSLKCPKALGGFSETQKAKCRLLPLNAGSAVERARSPKYFRYNISVPLCAELERAAGSFFFFFIVFFPFCFSSFPLLERAAVFLARVS